jgi:flagellar motor protein MotB
MSYLINHHHIDPNRLTIEGKGFSELADPAHPDSAANRRVQVTNLGQS